MKRTGFALLILFCAFAAPAATSITVSPSEMKNGETKSLVDGRNTITITRHGDDLDVKIEGAGLTRSLTITRNGDELSIERAGVRGGMFVLPPRPLLKERTAQTWFVCPKDHTMLRVPEEKAGQVYKCPVDGTTMEKYKGRGFGFFFDDGDFKWESL